MIKCKLTKTRYLYGTIMYLLCVSTSWSFTIDDVAKQAKLLASNCYVSPKKNLSSVFRDMKYTDYQKIQFNHKKAYWRNIKTPFKLEFHHQGMYFETKVKINEIIATTVREIKYSQNYFNYPKIKKYDNSSMKSLGFAGFKVLYPVNYKYKNDEVISILGASYFRVIGAGQVYGISARGLAIDTALSSGEEFPYFREFWIKRPNPIDKHLIIYALLDSPRATGAYRFIIFPGRDTVVNVQSKLYLRDKVKKLGIAPLTSMFLFGSNQPSLVTNFRPELHDSNGLSIHSGNNGEWIWRPLKNPKHLAVSSFTVDKIQCFGLLQRGRQFSRFEDLDDRYDLRPSALIVPKNDWGKGKIELVEIPSNDETNDNIVAYWIPDQLQTPGKEMNFKYTIIFSRNENKLHSPNNAYVMQTRRSIGDVKQSNLIRQPDGTIAFIIDFIGQNIKKDSSSMLNSITSQTSVGENGKIVENSVRYNPVIKGYRLTLRLKIKDPKQITEVRAALIKGKHQISETWNYQLPANE